MNGSNTPETNGRGTHGPKNNRPPVANAGADQVITLPSNSVNLNGSAPLIRIIILQAIDGQRFQGPHHLPLQIPILYKHR